MRRVGNFFRDLGTLLGILSREKRDNCSENIYKNMALNASNMQMN